MKPADISAGLSLCRAAGWNQVRRDWELFLNLHPEGCRVAVDEEDQVAGTVVTVRYEDHFNWIGMLLVDPAMKRQGIGIQLLREALQILSGEETVKLDATPEGRRIYLQLDFVDEYPLTRMQVGGGTSVKLPDSHARPIHEKDLPTLLALDKEVFGANRFPVLEWLWKGGPQYAFMAEEKDTILGYCFGRPGHNFTHIGPVVSVNFESAIDLVSAALRNCAGSPVVLDVLNHTPQWIKWLSSIGFKEQRPFIRMFRGTNAYPGIPKKQFAILGPEFG